MHISSTINPLSKSDGHIAVGVFRYNKQRKFLRVSEDYKEMLSLITRTFDIASNSVFSLQTSSLDACRGESVEIDESAYSLMLMLLDDVEVTVQEQERARAPPATLAPPTTTNSRSSSPANGREAPEKPSPSGSNSVPPTSASEEQEDGYTTINAYERDRQVYESRIDEDAEDEEEARRPSTSKDKSMNEEAGPNQKFKPVIKPASADSMPQGKKERVAEPAPKSQVAEKGNKSLRKEAGGAPDADTRFEISITGPEPNQTAQFKTRGKHTVGKVLAAACRTFEINYHRSRLFYVLSIEDNDGTEERVVVECDVDETMSQAGVNGDSQLFIKVDPAELEKDDLTHFD